jgi:hypothetical protein
LRRISHELTRVMNLFMKIVLIFFLFLWDGAGKAFCQDASPRMIGARFIGEEVQYEVGFWVFPAVGGGLARFYELDNGSYLIVNEGRAQGLAGWLSRHRREVQRAWLSADEPSNRLIPLRLEEESIIGDWVRKKTTRYDYSARRIFMETRKEGETQREVVEIPPGMYYDNPISAYYNFRYGAYGKVEPGREYLIPTVPRKGKGVFRVTVAPQREAALRREAEEEKKGKDLLVRIHLDQEFLGSPRGEIEVWFDNELNPVTGMIRKVRFFGDIKGRITHFVYRNLGKPPRSP